MRGAARLGVMIVVITFAERAEADPEIVLALVGRLESAIAELLGMWQIEFTAQVQL